MSDLQIVLGRLGYTAIGIILGAWLALVIIDAMGALCLR